MISVISTTNRYIVQPNMLDMHRQSLDWLSAIVLWKRELIFFQKLLDQHAQSFSTVEEKKTIDHFQSLITYYQGELIDSFRSKLLGHENQLATSLQKMDETDTVYYSSHKGLMDELASFDHQFTVLKHDFFAFIEQALKK